MFERLIRSQIKEKEKQLDRFLTRHEKEHPFPDGVLTRENIVYKEEDPLSCRADVFRPAAAEGVLPVMFNIHGGGFLLGKKEVNRHFNADFSKRGFLVISAEYPTAPDADIFRILGDLATAMKKAKEIAEEFSGDLTHFYLSGDSAGAWLCVYLATMQNNPSLAGAAGVDLAGTPKIRAVGLQSGMFYTDQADSIGMFLPKLIYGKGYKKHPFFPYINPESTAVTAHLPPVFLVTGRGDFLRHYSRRYAKALAKANVPCHFLDLSEYGRLSHAFPAILPEIPASVAANDAMADFFHEIM